MLRTYLYLPEDLQKKIEHTAIVQKKSKAQVIRQALEEGMDIIQKKSNSSAQIMLKITEIAKEHKAKGPADLSENLDTHLWGIENK